MYKVKYDFEEDPKEYKNWLVNDIFGYLNEEVAMMYGLVDNFYTTLMRYYSINDKQTIINITGSTYSWRSHDEVIESKKKYSKIKATWRFLPVKINKITHEIKNEK